MDYFLFDEDFVLEKDLRKLGFKKTDIDDTYARILDSVYALQDDLVNTDFKNISKEARLWKNNLRKALSHKVGKFVHKQRPMDNLFPMMNSGRLRDSLYVNVKDTSATRTWSYEISVGFKSPHFRKGKDHVLLTNYNITRSGLNTRHVSWYLWMDDVFNKGKPGIISVRDLMKSVLY